MNLINDKEMLKGYGMENRENIFTAIDKTTDSYWDDKSESAGVMKYGFDTPAEMTALLRDYIEDEKLRRIIVAASFKRINFCLHNEKNGGKAEEQPLPEFVYVF